METSISNNTHGLVERAIAARPTVFGQRFVKRLHKVAGSRRLLRSGVVALNVLLLVAIGTFVWRGSHAEQVLTRSGTPSTRATGSNALGEPLDQISSADIALNAAKAVVLYETPGLVNQAQSAAVELATAPADRTVIAKPQAVATTFASRKDIKGYTVVAGDNVSSIAAKFNITSDSVMWSNNLSGNTVNAGLQLAIPPVNGIVYTVKSGDTLDSLANKYRANKDQIIAVNDIELTGLKVGDQILIPNGQQPAPVIAFRASGTASYGPANGYDWGFCTWYAANRRAQMGNPVPSNLGNANTWAVIAASFNIPTGASPQVGAVAVKHSRAPGHVGVVESVNADGSFWMSEMNSYGQRSMTDSSGAGGFGAVDWKLVPADLINTYTYVY
ncbi:MAG TPA: LysM peptidoglycan-binding domain-containing protein [Candidatus Saccharimonadales bacterium]|nr:LysM peptidoglycan-binding domain-containing protein [Candidatus Saccharimonadales bacterium]